MTMLLRFAVLSVLSILCLFALSAQMPAQAQDLLQVYRDAKGYDALYAAARYTLQAGLEKLPQGRALILPTLDLSANTTNSRTETEPHDTAANPRTLRDARSYGYTMSF